MQLLSEQWLLIALVWLAAAALSWWFMVQVSRTTERARAPRLRLDPAQVLQAKRSLDEAEANALRALRRRFEARQLSVATGEEAAP